MTISTTSLSVTDRRLHCLAIVAMVLMIPFSPATAQTSDQEKFSISIGLFVTDRDSETRFDGQVGSMIGTNVDVESEFGLNTSDSVFRKRQTNSVLTAMRCGAIRFFHPDRG